MHQRFLYKFFPTAETGRRVNKTTDRFILEAFQAQRGKQRAQSRSIISYQCRQLGQDCEMTVMIGAFGRKMFE
jgi:hypothetical protein